MFATRYSIAEAERLTTQMAKMTIQVESLQSDLRQARTQVAAAQAPAFLDDTVTALRDELQQLQSAHAQVSIALADRDAMVTSLRSEVQQLAEGLDESATALEAASAELESVKVQRAARPSSGSGELAILQKENTDLKTALQELESYTVRTRSDPLPGCLCSVFCNSSCVYACVVVRIELFALTDLHDRNNTQMGLVDATHGEKGQLAAVQDVRVLEADVTAFLSTLDAEHRAHVQQLEARIAQSETAVAASRKAHADLDSLQLAEANTRFFHLESDTAAFLSMVDVEHQARIRQLSAQIATAETECKQHEATVSEMEASTLEFVEQAERQSAELRTQIETLQSQLAAMQTAATAPPPIDSVTAAQLQEAQAHIVSLQEQLTSASAQLQLKISGASEAEKELIELADVAG